MRLISVSLDVLVCGGEPNVVVLDVGHGAHAHDARAGIHRRRARVTRHDRVRLSVVSSSSGGGGGLAAERGGR
jgi:hypothetical protein